MAAAPAVAVDDEDNPSTKPNDWDTAISSRSLQELRRKLASRHRGPQKHPTKVATTIRIDPDVIVALKATGPGWQTRVNNLLREWLQTHRQD